MSLLEIKDLTIEFPSDNGSFKATDKINISVNAGEFVALVGESGSGKTMTSLSIMNLLPESARISEGVITFNGNGKSMIFQEPMTCLNPLLKIGRQIEESAIIKGVSKSDAHTKALELAKLTDLKDPEHLFNCYPHQLSGGMRQRVMIASALMTNPELLIADEPTTALDVSTQNEILKIIKDLNQKFNTALLLITHDFTVVKKMCSRVYIMYKGKIVEEGPTDRIFTSPKHPYTKALIDSIPDPSKKRTKLPSYFDSQDFLQEAE